MTPAAPSEKENSLPPKPGRILVAEDRAKELEAIGKLLQPLGYEIDLASGGKEAAEFLKRREYALLVTDLLMPEGTGFDLLSLLSKLKISIPVVVCSAYVTVEARESLRLLDHVKIVSKPYKPADLLEAVRELLERNRPTAERG